MPTPASYGSSLVSSFSPPPNALTASPPGKMLAFEQSRLSSIRQELERTKAMRRGMRELKYQSLVSLKRMQGLSEKDISTTLPVPVNTPSPRKADGSAPLSTAAASAAATAISSTVAAAAAVPPSPPFRDRSQRVEFVSTFQSQPPASSVAHSGGNGNGAASAPPPPSRRRSLAAELGAVLAPPPLDAIRIDVHLAPTPSLLHKSSPRPGFPPSHSVSVSGRATPRLGLVPVLANALYDVHVVSDDLSFYRRRRADLLGDVSIGPEATSMLQAFRAERDGREAGGRPRTTPKTGDEWMDAGRRRQQQQGGGGERGAGGGDGARAGTIWTAAAAIEYEYGDDNYVRLGDRPPIIGGSEVHADDDDEYAASEDSETSKAHGGSMKTKAAAIPTLLAANARGGALLGGVVVVGKRELQVQQPTKSSAQRQHEGGHKDEESDNYEEEEGEGEKDDEEREAAGRHAPLHNTVEPNSKAADRGGTTEARQSGAHNQNRSKLNDHLDSIIDHLENDVLRQHERLLALGLVDCELSFDSSVLGGINNFSSSSRRLHNGSFAK